MRKAISQNKLVAKVVGIADLDSLFPRSVLRGRIGLDVRVEQGSVSTGKRVRLSSPDSGEEVQIVGIEMLSDPHDPNVVRVHCSKPKVLAIPTGIVDGWSIKEQ